MEKYIIAVDQSTTGTKALLIDRQGSILHKCYAEHRQILPQPGWVEHNPMELLGNVRRLITQVMEESNKSAAEIQCLAITNQRETTLAWNRQTGEPVYNAIVWQCNRAGVQCERIRSRGLEEEIREKTGLPLSEFFSAPKLAWIIDNVPEAARLKDEGNLLCGTVDSWLVWNLSCEKSHVTDYSNASRMQLFDLHRLCWDEKLVNAFGLRLEMLPQIVFSDTVVGHMELDGIPIPIAGVIGDSHGALFAQCGLETGLKVTYGTGSSIMLGTGEKLRRCGQLATTVSYAFGGKVNYAVEGNINSTGATIKWLSDKLGLMDSAGQAEKLAAQLEDNGGVYLVPAFGGLGAPYWKPNAKAIIYGLSFDSDRRTVVRAGLESIAYQIADVVSELDKGENLISDSLMVDGKPTENKFLMKFQAGITGKKIVKNSIEEASAYGSALMAGLATGYWKKENINSLVKHGETIRPEMSSAERQRLLAGWHQAVICSIGEK